MNKLLRAKVKVQSIIEHKPENGPKVAEQISLSAVYSEDKNSENYSFSQATPQLQLNMTINNPNAFETLKEGKEYYLDFIPVSD